MKKFYIGLAIALSIGASNLALAGTDAKTLPGAACQPKYDEHDVYRNSQGYAQNTSGSLQYWTCPIVRDSMAPSLKRAWVYFVNNEGSMSCTLHSKSETGGTAGSLTRTTNLSGSTTQEFEYGALADNDWGYYYFRCGVTPGSIIKSYIWEENT